MEAKPKMPDPRPTELVDGKLTLELVHDFDRFSNGGMLMKLADMSIQVSDDDGEIGEFGMAMGGTLYWQVGGRTWRFNKEELIRLAIAADESYVEEASEPTTAAM